MIWGYHYFWKHPYGKLVGTYSRAHGAFGMVDVGVLPIFVVDVCGFEYLDVPLEVRIKG